MIHRAIFRLAVLLALSLALLTGGAFHAYAQSYSATYQASNVSLPPSLTNKTVPVTVTNTGSTTWNADGSTYLAYHLYQGMTLVTWSGPQTSLPTSVPPGESILLQAKLNSPATEGAYTIQWDMTSTTAGVFSGLGSPTFNVTMTVSADAAALTSLNPTTAIDGAAPLTLTLTGTNFTSDVSVNWNSSPRATTYVNATTLTAAIPASDLVNPGTAIVTVANATGTSNSATFTIDYKSPTLTSVTPNKAPAQSPDVTINITGGNFYNGSVVYASNIGGNGYLATTYVSPTQLTAVIPANRMLTPGSGTMIVRTPNKLKSSSTVSFTLTAPAPTISSLNPPSIAALQPAFTIVVNGTSFAVSGASIRWNGTALTTTPISDTQLQAQVPATALMTPGTAAITIVTTNGTSSPMAFTITLADQAITFPPVSPKHAMDPPFSLTPSASSGLPVTLTATGACTVSQYTVTLADSGICTLTASQAGNTLYNAAPNLSQTFNVNKVAQTIELTPIPDTPASAPPFSITPTASSGLPVTLSATGACTISQYTITLTKAGACVITASQAGNSIYETAQDSTITLTVTPPAFVTPTLTLDSLVQITATSIGVDFTWPDVLPDTTFSVNCGTLREQIATGPRSTCVYTKPGAYKLRGKFTVPGASIPQSITEVPVNIPAISPQDVTLVPALNTEGTLQLTTDGTPDEPVYQLIPHAYPTVVTIATTPENTTPTTVGIVESLDTSKSTVTLTDTESTDEPSTPLIARLRFHSPTGRYLSGLQLQGRLLSDRTLLVGGRHHVLLTAKTPSGAVVTKQAILQLARPPISAIVKVVAGDGPYPPASYRFRVVAINSTVKRDRLSFTWTVTKDDNPEPLSTVRGSDSLRVHFQEAGTYHIAMTIKGALSDQFTWTHDLTVPPLPDPSLPAILSSFGGPNRPPVSYRFRPKLPLLDSSERYTQIKWTIDGQPLVSPPNTTTLKSDGEHTVRLDATTSKDQVFSADTTIILEPNLPPQGSINCSRTKPAVTNATLICGATIRDPDGRIAKQRWVVPDLGLEKLQSSTMSFVIPNPPPVVTVEFHATDNSGTEYVFLEEVELTPPPIP